MRQPTVSTFTASPRPPTGVLLRERDHPRDILGRPPPCARDNDGEYGNGGHGRPRSRGGRTGHCVGRLGRSRWRERKPRHCWQRRPRATSGRISYRRVPVCLLRQRAGQPSFRSPQGTPIMKRARGHCSFVLSFSVDYFVEREGNGVDGIVRRTAGKLVACDRYALQSVAGPSLLVPRKEDGRHT